jgi:D-alanyl-D-alanine-carboxypeptidase/D-alanyl-D-alanine-endopeptidase
MKTILCYFFYFMIGLTTANGQNIHRINGSSITKDSLDREIKNLMSKAHVSGLGIAVYNKNKPVFVKTFGLANVQQQTHFEPSQVMYGASFSKTVFAYIIMQLVQEKVIDLDKPVVKYLPKPLPDYKIPGWNKGYQDIRNDKRYEIITARMCLSHTTGLPNWRWYEADKKLKFKFAPGTRYSYSGEGLYLLQFVIEQITGKDYETIARERVFIPFNMPNTSYLWRNDFANKLVLGHNKDGNPYDFMHWKEAGCAGTLCTSLEDYAKFYSAFIQHKGLSAATFNQMITPQVRIRSVKQFGPLALKDSTINDSINLSYGLGIGVFNTPAGRAFFKEGHDDGWGHYSIAYPDKGIAVVIMTNNDNGESIFKQLLADSIGDVYTPWFWEDYIPYTSL